MGLRKRNYPPNKDRIHFIYGLRHPYEEVIMYVGETIKPLQRFKSHLWDKTALMTGKSKADWVKQLKQDGCTPVMDIIDVCQEHEVRQRETYWIRYYRTVNPGLLNEKDK